MLDKSNKNVIVKVIGAAVVVFLVVLVVSTFFPSGPKSLDKILSEINVNTVTHQKVPVDVQADLKDSLPV
jgi:Ca-activated chloride channel family protein